MKGDRVHFLEAALPNLFPNAKSYNGIVFRTVGTAYSHVSQIFSGDGFVRNSGRFHIINEFGVVYTSLRLEWSVAELIATARNAGIPSSDLMPITIVAAEISLTKVLDLTDAGVLASLNLSKSALTSTKWSSTTISLTQVIGRIARNVGFEAILAPGKSGRINLNLIRGNFNPSTIKIINENNLSL